jgi:hypothetical protein
MERGMLQNKSLVIGLGIVVVVLIAGLIFVSNPLSPPAKVHQKVGDLDISIHYSSPAVRDRKIWGGLLPLNVLWRAGANEATVMEFSDPVIINETDIPPGKYSFFVIPRESTWTLVLNEEWNQFGTSKYSSDKDVVRMDVLPMEMDDHTERLAYRIDPDGVISLIWEKKKVSFPVKTQ